MIRNGLLKEAEEQMLNVLSRDENSLCLLLESARDRERENVLCRVGLSVLVASKEDAKREVEKWLARPFYVAPGR